ncbi:hypothetical protein WJX81_008367 [Elliptochloris bilobata]|uniref:Uncharacterized protein n=1 Tax=Elliptochloris bilobata TaxID=381761 RepID=A0AAW1QKK4_9CHLO
MCAAAGNGFEHSACNKRWPAVAHKVAETLIAAVLALSTVQGPAVAGEIEKLEGEVVPSLVERLGDIVNPEEESAAAAALSAVESEVTKLDETEQASGESAVQEQASSIQDTIEALKETFSLK